MLITRKAEGAIWGIISLIMLLAAVIHPRIIYCILVIVCGIIGIICYRSQKKKTIGKMCKDMVVAVIAILILCYWGQCLNVIFPYHAGYEYKKDIASLKTETPQKYYYFPDKIPESASGVEWICMPGFLQGSGYHKLFFYADEFYLQEVYDTYAEYAAIYTYDQYVWKNNDMKQSITIPGVDDIGEEERENVKVLILYDNQDVNHSHNGGLYINQPEGYICFFEQ